MNKYGVIDIGSNSIRLMVSDGVTTIYKTLETTQLSQGLQLTGYLNKEAMNRSIQAIEKLYKQAINDGANQVYVFATEAVRSASNKEEFILLLKQKNIDVDIIPSQYEAKIGFYGAYTKGKVCVMDIGGASTELAIGDEKGIYYSKSLPIGIVRIKDQCGENLTEAISYIEKVIQGYGDVPQFEEILAIGGTASSFASIKMKMAKYDTKKVDFYKLTYKDIEKMVKNIHSVPFDERGSIVGLSLKRRDVIVGGGLLLMSIMKYLNKDYLIVRESDNQEGYLMYKLGKIDI